MPELTRATRPGPQDWPDGRRVIVRRDPGCNCGTSMPTAGGSRVQRPHPRFRMDVADPRGLASATRPRRGPPPRSRGHRYAQPAVSRFRAEPDVARSRLPCSHLFAWLQIFGWGAQRSACGNRNGYACGSSPSPAGSSTPAADDCSGFREAGATTTSSTPPQRRWHGAVSGRSRPSAGGSIFGISRATPPTPVVRSCGGTLNRSPWRDRQGSVRRGGEGRG